MAKSFNKHTIYSESRLKNAKKTILRALNAISKHKKCKKKVKNRKKHVFKTATIDFKTPFRTILRKKIPKYDMARLVHPPIFNTIVTFAV